MAQYSVQNLDTEESHGIFDSLEEARSCVRFDRLTSYAIWKNDSLQIERCDANQTDPENIYNLPSMKQSIAEDRGR